MTGGALTLAFDEESDGPCRRRLGLGVALRKDVEEHSQRLAWRPQGRPVVPVGSCSSLADSRAEHATGWSVALCTQEAATGDGRGHGTLVLDHVLRPRDPDHKLQPNGCSLWSGR